MDEIRLELLPEPGRRALVEFVEKGSIANLNILRRYRLVRFYQGSWILTSQGIWTAKHYRLRCSKLVCGLDF